MGKPLNNLTGRSFGSLTAIRLGESTGNGARWICQCKCGNEKELRSSDLVEGKINSCGCEHGKRISSAFKTHGMTHTRTYSIWTNMKSRCRTHLDYAGRGIKVCDEWLKFDNFFADMGVCPDGMSLDRIDVNGNYEKSNCRWATHQQQMNNTRANVWLEHDGKRLTLTQWATEIGVKPKTLRSRIRYGFTMENILTPMLDTKYHKPKTKDLADGAELQDSEGNVIDGIAYLKELS